MALATTCPRCRTSFKVVPDQLKLRRGFVRCGVCQHVFSGVDFLRYVDDAVTRPAAGVGATPARRPGPAGASAAPLPGERAAIDEHPLDDAALDALAHDAYAQAPLPAAFAHATPPWAGDAPPDDVGYDVLREDDAGEAAGDVGEAAGDVGEGAADAGADEGAADAGAADDDVDGGAAVDDVDEAGRAAARHGSDAGAGRDARDVDVGDDVRAQPAHERPATVPHDAEAHAGRFARDDHAAPAPAPGVDFAFVASGEAPATGDDFAPSAPGETPVAADDVAPAAAGQAPAADDDFEPFNADEAPEARDAHRAADARETHAVDLPPVRPPADASANAHATANTRADADADAHADAYVDADADAAADAGVIPAVAAESSRRAAPDDAAAPSGSTTFDRLPARGSPGPATEVGDDAIDFLGGDERGRGFETRGSAYASVAAAVLALALAAQLAIGARDWLGAWFPTLRPSIAAAVAPLGLAVEAPRALDALTIESFELLESSVPGLIGLSALLRNAASHPVRWPSLELTLIDGTGTVVARRVLHPVDYLGAARPARADGVPAKSELPVRGALEMRDIAPTGYSVKMFYP